MGATRPLSRWAGEGHNGRRMLQRFAGVRIASMPQQRKSRASSKMIGRAREFRRGMTPAEELLWSRLRNRGIGFKFRRQQPIGRFIVDFYCPEERLAIELDSGAHALPREAEQDRQRDEWLAARGYRVLRFRNEEVLRRPEKVLETIGRVVRAQAR